jgi:hypothetical protein
MNFLTDPQEERSTLRPTDVLVYQWEGGKHVCVDLIGVSPVRDWGSKILLWDEKFSKLLQAKRPNMRKRALTTNTFEFLAPKTIHLLKRVQKVMHSNDVLPKSINVVFQRLDFAKRFSGTICCPSTFYSRVNI